MEQPWEQRWPLLLLTSLWPDHRKPNIETDLHWTVPWSPADFSRVLRDASVSAAGLQIFGRRQKSIEAKPREKKGFRVGHYKDFTEAETTHKKSLGTQGNWIAVLEKIYWRCVFRMEPRQNREELKLWKRQILSNSRLRCQKQRSLSWTQKCTKGLDSTRNQS